MRLHELTVTAFGPFADTVRVDFDELGAAGLFLLTGKTGAGKTSVLDAVCFGLYGDVPGDRASARALRCDHAADDAEPRVVLCMSVRGRTFRLSRSPAWDRPKRRGVGTRRVQAGVVVEEQRQDGWVPLTTRVDEAGHLVGELLGMTAAQFTQVALLPQGRFQTFLRASSAERHQVLQRLFRTSRFDDVERWLVEQRQEARRSAAAGQARCLGLLDRLCEVGRVERPEAWDLDAPGGLGALVDDGTVEAWVAATCTAAEVECERCRHAAHDADRALADLDADLTGARLVAAARQRGETARDRLHDLRAHAEDVARATARLERHAAATPLLPLAQRVATSDAALARARALAVTSRDEVARVCGDVPAGPAGLVVARGDVERQLGAAEGWLPREQELHELQRQHARAQARVRTLGTAHERSTEELARHARLLDELEAEQEVLAEAPDRVVELSAARAACEEGRLAAQELEELEELLGRAVEEQQQATEQAQALKEHYLELRERRISGMAAELATALAVGCSCPVCGSLDHPAPATGTALVGREAEDAARADAESADVLSQAAREVVSGLRSRRTALADRSGGRTLAHWERLAHEAATDLEQAAARRTRLVEVQGLLAEARERRTATLTALAATAAEVEATRATLADLGERAAAQEAELAGLLGADDAGHASVSDLVEHLRRRREVLDDAAVAQQQEADAASVHTQAAESAHAAATAAGFASVAEAEQAALDTAVADLLTTRVERWHAARREAEHELAAPDVVAALAGEPVDLPALEQARTRQRDVRDLHLAAHRTAEQGVRRLAELRADLASALETWEPERRRHADVASLAALVEGTSADNALRMRLSGYVLAERLRQVVAAANERLARMTDQRFALEHSEEKGAGEQRGGLSLRVRDDWSGTVRDPATLSGGESFVVSLALALGLADTVSHEAGGTEVETLFVDEGFGSLDADTLDAVMDVLDGLRDGGRVVGIVSHVAELRARVPAQLEVRKGHDGSTLGSTVQAVTTAV